MGEPDVSVISSFAASTAMCAESGAQQPIRARLDDVSRSLEPTRMFLRRYEPPVRVPLCGIHCGLLSRSLEVQAGEWRTCVTARETKAQLRMCDFIERRMLRFCEQVRRRAERQRQQREPCKRRDRRVLE
jgi:hypothetical protein